MNKTSSYIVHNYNFIFLLLCLSVHIWYTLFFLFYGIIQMSIINGISSACYLLFLKTLKKYPTHTILTAYVEIYIYSLIATVLLGFESDFYLYIVGMQFASIIMFQKSGKARMFAQTLGIVFLFLSIFADRYGWLANYSCKYIMNQLSFTLRLLNSAIACVTILFLSLVYVAQLRASREKLEYVAEHDPLTGLYTRAYFYDTISAHSSDNASISSVIMIDIDNFKKINDTFGRLIVK